LTGTGAGGDAPYIAQGDGFFSQLAAWGDTIWSLWTHNMSVDGAAPFLMASASVGTVSPGCNIAPPDLDSATPGNGEVDLTWTAVDGADGYRVYYDQAGKTQFVADVKDGNQTSYLDTGLSNGIEYCYGVTAYTLSTDGTTINCESLLSNILCATPNNQGQTNPEAGVVTMEAGYWTGKGKNVTWNSSPIPAGETVIIRAHVVANGTPISNATVEIVIGGPETVTLNSGPSDADGWAEASWSTKAPGKRNPGTTPGSYTATTVKVTASGYSWDGVTTQTNFTIE
jgi:hypothetical protein